MCTVKDHLVQVHGIIYGNKTVIMLNVDELSATINCDNPILQLPLNNSCLTSTNVIFTDFTLLDLYKYDEISCGLETNGWLMSNLVPVGFAVTSDQDIVTRCHKINCRHIMTSPGENGADNDTYEDTSIISLLLLFTLLLCLFCNEIANKRMTGIHVNTDSIRRNHGSVDNFDKLDDAVCKEESSTSMLTVTGNEKFLSLSVSLDVSVLHYQDDLSCCDVLRPIGKDVDPVSLSTNQQSFTSPLGAEGLAPQEDRHNATESVTASGQADHQQQDVQQANAATEDKDQPSKEQPKDRGMSASNAIADSSHLDNSSVKKDGHTTSCVEKKTKVSSSNLEQNIVERDGMLSMPGGIDQATPISTIPSEHKLMIGNAPSKPSDYNPSGAHIVKGLPKQTELLPTVGPQLDALYNTNFDHEVQSSREEIRQKAKPRTTFYQHEVEQAYNPVRTGGANIHKNPPVDDKLQVKVPEVKAETGKAANDFKPKPLPRRSHIVSGSMQYPLARNLLSHPHMDHYFVKERTEIRPSHYLAKLVLRHHYLNR